MLPNGQSLRTRRGGSPKTVAERLGHESVKITLDIYTHVTKQSDERAASLLDFG